MIRSSNRFGVVKFQNPDGRIRAIVVDRTTLEVSLSGSVYEASLRRRYSSHNTLGNALVGLASLLSWAKVSRIRIEKILLEGQPLGARQIDQFCIWLEDCQVAATGGGRNFSASYFNSKLVVAKQACDWFVQQFFQASDVRMRPQEVSQAKQYMAYQWRLNRKRVDSNDIAPDISDEEILAIELHLQSRLECGHCRSQDVRTYLIWRLAMEFGLRIGEILALRVQDCPNRFSDTIKIVRIEERIGDQLDPRGTGAPRPKTRSRELSPVVANSRFPDLIYEYVSTHRTARRKNRQGEVRKSFRIPHQFLIVNDTGDPLSNSTAKSLAAKISRDVGVPFHWHLARHAFFNRAWGSIAQQADAAEREMRVQDLVYWGGWSSQDSLGLYSRRARKHRAAHALTVWNGSSEVWDALN